MYERSTAGYSAILSLPPPSAVFGKPGGLGLGAGLGGAGLGAGTGGGLGMFGSQAGTTPGGLFSGTCEGTPHTRALQYLLVSMQATASGNGRIQHVLLRFDVTLPIPIGHRLLMSS